MNHSDILTVPRIWFNWLPLRAYAIDCPAQASELEATVNKWNLYEEKKDKNQEENFSGAPH